MTRLSPAAGFFSPLILLFLFSASCSSTYNRLHGHVLQSRFGEAVAYTDKDAKKETLLAAIILADRAINNGSEARELIFALDGCKNSGQQVIKKIKEGDKNSISTMIAVIVSNKNRRPSFANAFGYLDSDFSDVRSSVATVYGTRLNNSALKTMTADINPVVRSAAVYALCRKKNSAFNQTQSAAELLRKDPSPFVRVAAAGCLPFNSDTLMAVDTLKNAVLTQDNINIKLAAAAALITINTPHSLDIAKEFTNGPLTPFKINLLAMLTVLKDKKTEMRFLDALNDEIAQNRAAGIKKLLETGIENPEFFLKKALKDEPVAAVAAAQELIKISKETKAALSRLEQIWKEGGNFAEQAKKVMAAAGSKEALDSIAADLKETGSDGRNAAGLLIEKYKDITALRPLFVHLLASEHQKIRVEAARAVIFQCMLSSRQH